MEVFNRQVTIELPEGYEPWDIKEPGAEVDSGLLISLLSNSTIRMQQACLFPRQA